jgi:hypothetical protein
MAYAKVGDQVSAQRALTGAVNSPVDFHGKIKALGRPVVGSER